jgi:hypothetical protein
VSDAPPANAELLPNGCEAGGDGIGEQMIGEQIEPHL